MRKKELPVKTYWDYHRLAHTLMDVGDNGSYFFVSDKDKAYVLCDQNGAVLFTAEARMIPLRLVKRSKRLQLTQLPTFLEDLLEVNWAVDYDISLPGDIARVVVPVQFAFEGKAGFKVLRWLREMSPSELCAFLAEIYYANDSVIEAWEYICGVRILLTGRECGEKYYERYASLKNKRERLMTDFSEWIQYYYCR